MKFALFTLAVSAGIVNGFPGMRGLMVELAKRQAGGPPNIPMPLIGDLATIGAVTPVGTAVLSCINSTTGACQNTNPKTYVAPGPLGSNACAQDTCCVWDSVATDLVALFTECDGQCNDLARAAVRFGFHDAASWNLNSTLGGADGSLFLNDDEINRPENNGLQAWRAEGLKILKKYESYGVGAADLAQFAHNVATVVCPLGPRTLTYVGRQSSAVGNERGLLPDTNSPSDVLIKLFTDKSTSFVDLIALIGAHTTAKQRFVDPSKAGQPLDATPGIWDILFYQEVLNGETPPEGVFRLPSDNALAADNTTRTGFVTFANPTTGQGVWNALYSKAYLRMSLFGVNNINDLTDCTHVLPTAITSFTPGNATCSSSSSSSSTPMSSTATPMSSIRSSSSLIASASPTSSSNLSSLPVSSSSDLPPPPVSSCVVGSSVQVSTIFTTKTITTRDCAFALICPKRSTKTLTSTIPVTTRTTAVTTTSCSLVSARPSATQSSSHKVSSTSRLPSASHSSSSAVCNVSPPAAITVTVTAKPETVTVTTTRRFVFKEKE